MSLGTIDAKPAAAGRNLSTEFFLALTGLAGILSFLAATPRPFYTPLNPEKYRGFYYYYDWVELLSFVGLEYLVLVAAYSAIKGRPPKNVGQALRSSAIFAPISFAAVFFVFFLLLDDVLAAVSFYKENSLTPIKRPPLAEFVSSILQSMRQWIWPLLPNASALEYPRHNRMPCGVALRAWLIFLTASALVATRQSFLRPLVPELISRRIPKTVAFISKYFVPIIIISYFAMFLYVSLARIYLGFHYPVDVAMSVAVGTLVFLLAVGILVIGEGGLVADKLNGYVAAYAFVAFSVFFIISDNTIFWAIAAPAASIVIGLCREGFERRQSEQDEKSRRARIV